MFIFGNKNLESLSDEQVEKAYSRDAKRRARRKTASGLLFLALFFGGAGLGVGAMALTGLLTAAAGGGALVLAFCGALVGCIGSFSAASKIKPLNDWMDSRDLNEIVFERQRRVKQQEELKTVLSPAAAAAFAASVGNGVKDNVKILKPLQLRRDTKPRRPAFTSSLQ